MGRKETLEKMREVLITRRDAIRKALAGDLSLLNDLREQSSGDVVDFALDSAQDELNSQLAEVESRELEKLDVALAKMRNGTFGCCEGCNAAIPLVRLQALPYAQYCIQCQTEIEQNGELSERSEVTNLLSTNDNSLIGGVGMDLDLS